MPVRENKSPGTARAPVLRARSLGPGPHRARGCPWREGASAACAAWPVVVGAVDRSQPHLRAHATHGRIRGQPPRRPHLLASGYDAAISSRPVGHPSNSRGLPPSLRLRSVPLHKGMHVQLQVLINPVLLHCEPDTILHACPFAVDGVDLLRCSRRGSRCWHPTDGWLMV